MQQEFNYSTMFTAMRRFYGAQGVPVIKHASKRAAKMAANIQKEKEEQEYPTFKTTEESIAFKKDYSQSMWKSYSPDFVERDWDDWWVQKKYFACDAQAALKVPQDKRYVICWPPSNVTGYLHTGHAITAAIEDCLVRWKRMNGYQTLFVPGVDHAGIATQVVVEQQLAKKGISRHDLGRDKFVEEAYKWKDHSCERIVQQLKKLGVSPDWDKFVFTMDEDRNEAVIEAFIRLKETGIIYRDNRLVNWSCSLNSAISNIEVDQEDFPKPRKINVPGYTQPIEFGTIMDFSYKVKGTDKTITVSTTRLETMLGDVAVAVHSTDERYKDLIGKELEHPFIPDRKIVVIADDTLVDKEFGTGAVKVTPAHDPNDYNCGKRNNLQMINILNDDGTMNENCGKFAGMKRYDVRELIAKELEELKLFGGKRANPMVIGICSRSKDIVEPLLKPQWYVKMTDELKQHMFEKAKSHELHIIPSNFEKIWNDWTSKLEDWCISRQLWWGHRCPAYLVKVKGGEEPDQNLSENWVVGRNLEEATVAAEKLTGKCRDELELSQDEDVLDTWFSSALFPFSITGWPKETPEFKAFFPNTILETGSDIIFFWVARMVIMSYYLCDKQLPFREVFLHSIVRDESGEKMSKSKGNVIDPLEVIDGCELQVMLDKLSTSNLSDKEKKKAIAGKQKKFPKGIPQCGSDALRFGLLGNAKHAKDINLDLNVLISQRQFSNKIWNTFKFIMMNIEDGFKYDESNIKSEELFIADKWILANLNKTIKTINESLEGYHFHQATSAFTSFWVDQFCAVYLEYTKSALQDPEQALKVKTILFHVTEVGLRLLHPMMVFVSEELYQKLPAWNGKSESIVIAQYPLINPLYEFEGIEGFQTVQNIIDETRKIFGGVTLLPKAKPDISIVIENNEIESSLVNEFTSFIIQLTKAGKVSTHLTIV